MQENVDSCEPASLALAMDLAHTVLLVDADMRRPGVHQAFGMERCPGLTEYLFDEIPLEQLLRYILASVDLCLFPGTHDHEFLGGAGFAQNGGVGGRAQTPLSGAPAGVRSALLLSRADVHGFVPHIDALLLVVEEGRTGSSDVARAMTALKGSVPILGGVLNMSGRGEMTSASRERST